jgi:hypothetical protein
MPWACTHGVEGQDLRLHQYAFFLPINLPEHSLARAPGVNTGRIDLLG